MTVAINLRPLLKLAVVYVLAKPHTTRLWAVVAMVVVYKPRPFLRPLAPPIALRSQMVYQIMPRCHAPLRSSTSDKTWGSWGET
jgi:hypothetical protein